MHVAANGYFNITNRHFNFIYLCIDYIGQKQHGYHTVHSKCFSVVDLIEIKWRKSLFRFFKSFPVFYWIYLSYSETFPPVTFILPVKHHLIYSACHSTIRFNKYFLAIGRYSFTERLEVEWKLIYLLQSI